MDPPSRDAELGTPQGSRAVPCGGARWARPGRGVAVPFQQVEAELVAVGQGEQLRARAHAHEPLHLHRHTQYPSDLSRKVRAD